MSEPGGLLVGQFQPANRLVCAMNKRGRLDSGGQISHHLPKFISAKTGNESAAIGAGVGQKAFEGTKGIPTDRAIYRLVIAAPGIALKQHPTVLHKFLRTRFGFKLACQTAAQIFKLGQTLLQIFIFFNQQLRLVAYQRQVVPENCGAPVLSD
jgi:hypothetical protein